jgi:penicillin-binding protein 1A
MEPDVAYLMTDLLTSVVQRGTAKRAASLGRPLAGKTGTTNRAKDAWFIGYSTDLVVAVWVGFDDALPLGWGESGATSALPIWIEFIKSSHEGKPATEFPRPPGLSEVLIDPKTGLLARYGQEDAETEIFLKGTEPTETAPEPDEAEDDPADAENEIPEETEHPDGDEDDADGDQESEDAAGLEPPPADGDDSGDPETDVGEKPSKPTDDADSDGGDVPPPPPPF